MDVEQPEPPVVPSPWHTPSRNPAETQPTEMHYLIGTGSLPQLQLICSARSALRFPWWLSCSCPTCSHSDGSKSPLSDNSSALPSAGNQVPASTCVRPFRLAPLSPCGRPFLQVGIPAAPVSEFLGSIRVPCVFCTSCPAFSPRCQCVPIFFHFREDKGKIFM